MTPKSPFEINWPLDKKEIFYNILQNIIFQPLKTLHNGIPIILHNKQIYNNSKVPFVGPEVNKKPLPPVSADSVHYKVKFWLV